MQFKPEHNQTGRSQSAPSLLRERRGAIGHIKLNRPEVLNSLTLDMVRDIEAALDEFERDKAIIAIVISGEGERGLCAGGDLRAFYEAGRLGPDLAKRFWAEEYRLNARLNRYPKPSIAVMDGIVMGAGAGISVYCRYRLVTERTRFAMPETGIGFFPDVGASWFLSRQGNEFGTYAALTGKSFGAAETIALGLADIYVPSERLPALVEALARLASGATGTNIGAAIQDFAEDAPPTKLDRERLGSIDRAFTFDTVEEIFAALEHDNSPFAAEMLNTLRSRSPFSLKVTLRLLRLGRRSASLEDCLEREFAATAAVLENEDFREGIRAAIIDKDRNPHWQAATLGHVGKQEVDAFFPQPEKRLFA
ncbi:MAG: enoyl-CoA hydratase/isomerase family protein [Hyphomicrobiales bacterium]